MDNIYKKLIREMRIDSIEGIYDNSHPVGKIGNTYGGLFILEHDGKYYWSISCVLTNIWEEIPEKVYKELYKLKS